MKNVRLWENVQESKWLREKFLRHKRWKKGAEALIWGEKPPSPSDTSTIMRGNHYNSNLNQREFANATTDGQIRIPH